MKDLVRIKSLISADIENLLNQQIKKEAHSAALYLSMASWCDRNGFDNSAEYFYKQSDEERQHQLKIFHYVCDMGGTAISPDTNNVKIEFSSFREVFEDALDAEIAITQSFKNIAARCHKEQDYVTLEFLNWFFKEQREEEYKARRALELFDLIGEEGTGRWEIDKHVQKISYSGDSAGE
ncbi:Ferritin Dps family protein [Pseudopedobacter saltans DSM 12145]|uniref:Ferritin n=1 Tax=Pseudopedobacter saltans (strain ATCC 51119 / DSM 12145 / JCM 21818 / CCUG 39354 / LMG 10337 / NBRC 100064 / NCIMB 13643) TaxID=762903 RepID=F0S5N8_PSESL|nr:ferritin [Pseudopedobacter saltans]ADY54212.1 Ferritin Dps family protein [Pseudopedobacter saltans DSM 12145]